MLVALSLRNIPYKLRLIKHANIFSTAYLFIVSATLWRINILSAVHKNITKHTTHTICVMLVVEHSSHTTIIQLLRLHSFACEQQGIWLNVMPFSSSWPSDAMWRHRSAGSTFARIIVCCLTVPSHYLNLYWIDINGVPIFHKIHSKDGTHRVINSKWCAKYDMRQEFEASRFSATNENTAIHWMRVHEQDI